MAKAFFSHDCDARLSKKMLMLRAKHGPAGYGVYWMLVERLRAEEGFCSEKNYTMLSFDFHADEELIRSVVEDFGLFDLSADGKSFCSHGLNERMELAETRSKAGRSGAEARWKGHDKNGKNGKNMASSCDANANKINKRNAIQNSISISPSLDSFPKGSESNGEISEEEKEKILFEFVFGKNLASPEKELELFWEYNNSNGKDWGKMTEARKENAIKRWRQEPTQEPRFKQDFLAMWREVYETIKTLDAPIETLLDMLSDKVSVSFSGKYVHIYCSEAVARCIENEDVIRKVRPVVMGYVQANHRKYIQYKVI